MDEHYQGREQSAAKHLILRDYLEKLVYKVGSTQPGLTLNYIDGFAGPWQSKTADLSDTSPSIVLQKLLEVRDKLSTLRKNIGVRAFFVSPNARGVEQLSALRGRFPSAEIEIVKNTFENALDAACRFARCGQNPFTFVFIDHTGWTGFGLREIAPLLREGRNEVLINFMTEHIKRFVDLDDPKYAASFVDLFGDAAYRDEWRGLEELEREDRIVETYCRRIALAGGYKHCVSSVVLKPTEDRSYFHLVYGTRSDEGLVTFRGVERTGLKFQRTARAGAKQRKRVERSGRLELFDATVIGPRRTHEDVLRDRYLSRARAELDAMTKRNSVSLWDTLVLGALQIPMISESDVREWLDDSRDSGIVELLNLEAGKRAAQRGRGDQVRRLK